MKKEVLIFGANGALGKGITDVFLSKDYDKVHLFDFDNRSGELPENAEFHKIENLADEKNAESAFGAVVPSKETLYFLYSTIGGYTGGKALWETEFTEFDRMMKMNLHTSFLIGKHFSRLVEASGGGSICFTAAYTGLVAEQNKVSYGTSKGALVHFIKLLAEDGLKINLTANAIAPYIIDTPANREWMKESEFDNMIKPEEIGQLAHEIFRNFHFISGNIITLKNRLKRVKYNE